MESTLKVRVYDKDTLSDDILGDHDVNLNLQNLVKEDAESEVPTNIYSSCGHMDTSSGHVYSSPDTNRRSRHIVIALLQS